MKRKLNKFQKVNRGHRSKSEKWGVNRRKRVDTKQLLVTGTGRCGTRWIHLMLQKLGLDIGHEVVRKDGTVSWYFCTDSDWYPMHPWRVEERKAHIGERRSDFVFLHTIHIVRHPLDCITSIYGIMQSIDFEFLEENRIIAFGIEPKLLRAMNLYYHVNKKIELMTRFRFQSEALFRYNELEWDRFMQCAGIGNVFELPCITAKNKATGFYKKKRVTWANLARLDAPLTAKIKEMARDYGYSL